MGDTYGVKAEVKHLGKCGGGPYVGSLRGGPRKGMADPSAGAEGKRGSPLQAAGY